MRASADESVEVTTATLAAALRVISERGSAGEIRAALRLMEQALDRRDGVVTLQLVGKRPGRRRGGTAQRNADIALFVEEQARALGNVEPAIAAAEARFGLKRDMIFKAIRPFREKPPAPVE